MNVSSVYCELCNVVLGRTNNPKMAEAMRKAHNRTQRHINNSIKAYKPSFCPCCGQVVNNGTGEG